MDQFTLQNEIVEYIEQDCLNEAYDLLINEYVSCFNKDAFFYLSMSDIFLTLKDYDSVILCLNEWNKNSDFSNERYGDAYFGLGDFKQANNFYLKCPHQDLDDSSFRILFMIASSFYNLGKYKESISYYEDFLLDNDDFDAYFFCANAYSFTKQINEAKRYYDKAYTIANDPQKIELINFLIQNPFVDIKGYIDFLEDPFYKEIYTIVYLLHSYQFSKAYSMILAKDESLLKHFLLGYYYSVLNDQKNSQFEFNAVLNSKIENEQDLELFQFTLDTYFNIYNQAIQSLFVISKNSISTYIYILQYLYHYKKYTECLDFYNQYVCDMLSNSHEVDKIILDCMFQVHEYEKVLDYISNEAMEPKTLDIVVIEIKTYLALDNIKAAKSISQAIMPNGYVAIEWLKYFNRNMNLNAIEKVISFMETKKEKGCYIPGYNMYIHSLKKITN